MATARGDEPGRYGGDPYGGDRYGGDRDAGDRYPGDRTAGDRYGGGYAGDRPREQPPVRERPRPQRRPSLLAEIADLEPDRLTPARRLVAAAALATVVLALAAAAAFVVYGFFGLIG